MARILVSEMIAPAEVGSGLHVKAGQTMRIIAIEGPQVADVAVLNAHDYKETYDAPLSYVMNRWQGTGNYHKICYLYSRLPRANLMMEITEDTVGRHWVANAGHCCPPINKLMGLPESARSCWGSIAEAISSCPGNQSNITRINDGQNKALKVESWQGLAG